MKVQQVNSTSHNFDMQYIHAGLHHPVINEYTYIHAHVHESSEGSSSTLYNQSKIKGNHPSAYSGAPTNIHTKRRALVLRTKSTFRLLGENVSTCMHTIVVPR